MYYYIYSNQRWEVGRNENDCFMPYVCRRGDFNDKDCKHWAELIVNNLNTKGTAI